MDFTKQQLKAIETNSKRVVVVSCAGSGKTSVIVKRIERLWNLGVDPNSILALTFSNKASREMKIKLKNVNAGHGVKTNVQTFHSFGLRLIRKYYSSLGFSKQPRIARQQEYLRILRESFNEKSLDFELNEKPFIEYLNYKRTNLIAEENEDYNGLCDLYSSNMKLNNLITMDDMVTLPIEFLIQNKEEQENVSNEFKFIFVDEYQDTNQIQNKFLETITTEDTSLFFVGDDDQSIYEWRGADSSFIKETTEKNDFEVIKLEENFRSQAEIINVAGKIINNNKNRIIKNITATREKGAKPFYKKLHEEKEEAQWVAYKIKELLATNRFNASDIAILSRNNNQLFAIEEALDQLKIKYENYANDENAQYTTFISVLSSIIDLSNTKDLGDAINFPSNCFDNSKFVAAKAIYVEKYGEQNYTSLEWINKLYLSDIEFEGSDLFRERYALITQLHNLKDVCGSEIINYYISYMKSKKYDETYKKEYAYLLSSYEIAKNYENAFSDCGVKNFLDHLLLSYEKNEINRSFGFDAINLMTVHKSKGLEFKVVFIIGVQVGVFPNGYYVKNDDDLEAERRLLYVAITRARELLFLTSYRDGLGAVPHEVIKCGFMAEIPEIAFGLEPTKEEIIKNFPVKEKLVDCDGIENEIISNINAKVNEINEEINNEVIELEKNEPVEENVDIHPSSEEENAKKYDKSFSSFEEDDVERYVDVCIDLSKKITIPPNFFIVIIGNLDIKLSIAKAILKANGFGNKQVEFYDYNGKGFKIDKYLYQSRCLGIILGPQAHKIEGVDSSSLNGKLSQEEGYPYSVNLINRHITKSSLQEAIAKIKWNHNKLLNG